MDLYTATHISNIRNIIEHGINSQKDRFNENGETFFFDTIEEATTELEIYFELFDGIQPDSNIILKLKKETIENTEWDQNIKTKDNLKIHDFENGKDILNTFLFEDKYYLNEYKASFEYYEPMNTYNVFVYNKEKEISNLSGTIENGKLFVQNIYVEPEHRNKGIALWIYEQSLKQPYIKDINYNKKNVISKTINDIYQKLGIVDKKNKKSMKI